MVNNRGQFEAIVVTNVALCREHFRLTLRLQQFPVTRPGQFVQLRCQDTTETFSDLKEHDWEPGKPLKFEQPELLGKQAMLRRPFSLAGRRDVDHAVELDIIHRVVGTGTDWLSQLKTGDAVSVLGPLGNGFELPTDKTTALLVGGGVGIPPMIYLAEKLRSQNVIAFAGAITRDMLSLTICAPAGNETQPAKNIEEFARLGIGSVISTDDGSFGYHGFITQALEGYLDEHASQNASTIIYTCGPEPMMKRVADLALTRNIPCQIAVERAMACGMGTCQSCCIRVKKTDPPGPSAPPMAGQDWAYRLACTDGPVFLATDLLW